MHLLVLILMLEYFFFLDVEWFHLVISTYPLSISSGSMALTPERDISPGEGRVLLDLFRKQRLGAGVSAAASQLPLLQKLLSGLTAVCVGYCWKEFTEEDWDYLLHELRSWIQTAVVMMEEVAENVNDVITNISHTDSPDIILKRLEQIVLVSDSSPLDVARDALLGFALFCETCGVKTAEGPASTEPPITERWVRIKDRILEGILRLFFSTGLAEAIASSYSHEAASVVASSRLHHYHFWELVALIVRNSSPEARDRAVKSVEFWGLSKGAISSLYALLFASKPVHSLQLSAYVILSIEPVSRLAIVKDIAYASSGGSITNNEDEFSVELSSDERVSLREEISCMIEKLPCEEFELELMTQKQVILFLVSNFVAHQLHNFFHT